MLPQVINKCQYQGRKLVIFKFAIHSMGHQIFMTSKLCVALCKILIWNVNSVLHCKTGQTRFHYRIVCVPLCFHCIKFGFKQLNVREAGLLFRGTRAGAGNILFVQIVGPRDLPCRPRMPSDACRLPSKHFESYCIV